MMMIMMIIIIIIIIIIITVLPQTTIISKYDYHFGHCPLLGNWNSFGNVFEKENSR
jgi:hypothetical protein